MTRYQRTIAEFLLRDIGPGHRISSTAIEKFTKGHSKSEKAFVFGLIEEIQVPFFAPAGPRRGRVNFSDADPLMQYFKVTTDPMIIAKIRLKLRA